VGADSAGRRQRGGLVGVDGARGGVGRRSAALARQPDGRVPGGAAVLVFLPTSNLLFPIGTIMAERFLYLPAIAFAAGVVAAVWCGWTAGGRGRASGGRAGAVGLIVVACGRGRGRAIWIGGRSFGGKAAVEASPGSFKSHKLLAWAMHEADPGHANIDTVIEEAEKGLAPLRDLPDARSNGG